jgi:hypothetical protein
MHAEEVVITLILMVGGIIAYGLMLRYRKRELQHKERLAALEKGMALPDLSPEGQVWSPRVYLLRGMLWLFGGIAVVAFLGAISAATQTAPRLEERLYRAKNLRDIGASEEQIKKVMDDDAPVKDMPGAVALLGLVPIGVGLAYLIYYRVESKSGLPEVRRESSL